MAKNNLLFSCTQSDLLSSPLPTHCCWGSLQLFLILHSFCLSWEMLSLMVSQNREQRRGTKKKAFLEAGEVEGGDQDFPGHVGTGRMDTKENICKKVVEIVAMRKWLVSSMVFMLPSGYFCVQNKHERQNTGIVWVVIFNTLLYKYFVTACVCIIGVGLFFS